MKTPQFRQSELVERLSPPQGKIKMVLDTDTYNEVDDQFALAYTLKSQEKLDLKAVYAAPFHNDRSSGPEDGMEKSYQEINKILSHLNIQKDDFVFRGSRQYLPGPEKPVASEAAEDLIDKALNIKEGPLYVVAIGAATNVASAILKKPSIIKNIVVVWLGGNALYWPHTYEFNLQQDLHSSRVLFDSGVPLVQIPCMGVADHLLTTIPELKEHLEGKSKIGSYLTDIVSSYTDDPFGWSKVIWDISAPAYLINSDWVATSLVHSPVLTDQMTWSEDRERHFIRSAYQVDRDQIFTDVFTKLSK